jgi:hypothetical protein
MMIEVTKQLIVPEKLAEGGHVSALQSQMECPDCHFVVEPIVRAQDVFLNDTLKGSPVSSSKYSISECAALSFRRM